MHKFNLRGNLKYTAAESEFVKYDTQLKGTHITIV